MIHATPEQTEQFTRLMHTQVHLYVKACIEERRDLLERCTSDVAVLRVVQGEIKALRAILQLIEYKKA